MNNTPKVPFSEAAARLSALCNRIDNSLEDIDELLNEEFQDALTDVTGSIDRRKALIRETNSKIELAKKFRQEVDKAIKRYENLVEKITNRTIEVIQANPDISFKDSLGNKLSVCQNQPRLILSPYTNFEFIVEETAPYLREIKDIEFDKEKIKQDLLDGKELSFAKLEYGLQVRGLN